MLFAGRCIYNCDHKILMALGIFVLSIIFAIFSYLVYKNSIDFLAIIPGFFSVLIFIDLIVGILQQIHID